MFAARYIKTFLVLTREFSFFCFLNSGTLVAFLEIFAARRTSLQAKPREKFASVEARHVILSHSMIFRGM